MEQNSAIVNSASFWEERYRAGQTGWDHGRAAPAFERLLSGTEAPRPGRLAVIGCGRGHDAHLFARSGFRVVGFDFAPSAIADAEAAAARDSIAVEYVLADIFALPDIYDGGFDYVVERACFCAIDPARRAEYVSAVARLLRPGGELIALFFTRDRPGGPPFSTSEAEIKSLFRDSFTLDYLAPDASSTAQDSAWEVFSRLKRR